MGKGEIISSLGGGEYSVKLIYAARDRITNQIATINAQIAALNDRLAEMEDGIEKTLVELQIATLEKSKDYYTINMPADPTIAAWCTDHSDGLAGSVGTIEIPGERDEVLIRPGFMDDAVFDADRDGQLQPTIGALVASFMYNLMLLPGWQKFLPTYRLGTIVVDSINFSAHTCDICLDPAYSSQQNMDVNRSQDFSDCDFESWPQMTDFCSRYPAHPT